MSDRDRQLFQYWEALEGLIASKPGPVEATAPTKNTWVAHKLAHPGTSLNVALVPNSHRVRVELFMDGDAAHCIFDRLKTQRDEIEAVVGSALVWEAKPSVRRRKIYIKREDFFLDARSEWADQHEWLRDMLNRFHAAFTPALANLERTVLLKGDQ